MNEPELTKKILDYWFDPARRKAWFNASPAMDEAIRRRFEHHWEVAEKGQYDAMVTDAESALALVILLDQMPLNMFRGEGKRYSTEQQAVAIARQAIEQGWDLQLDDEQKAFLYMPLMHSENLDDQDLSVQKFEQADLQENLRFAQHHRDLIQRFGRFPHRNEDLERDSTAEELAYLESGEAFIA